MDDVPELVAEWLSTLDQIKVASSKLPAQINRPDLPYVVCSAEGPGRWSMKSIGLAQIERSITVVGLVSPIVAGETIATGQQLALPVLQAMAQSFLYDRSLGGRVSNITLPFTDAGIGSQKLPGGTEYWGFQLRVPVVIIFAMKDLVLPADYPINHVYVNGAMVFEESTGQHL